MNPAYTDVRFRAEPPPGGLPEAFGIVTAWNPDGKSCSQEANDASTERLRGKLLTAEIPFFPVTGGSPDFSHIEPGFGIVAPLESCLALGRESQQEAIFRVDQRVVHLVSCITGHMQVLNHWDVLLAGPS